MCNCRSDIEARLLEKVKGQLPEDIKDLSVTLGGYAFFLGGDVTMKNVLPINVEYKAPIKPKKGAPAPAITAFKTKKQTMNMTGNYCMFCGEKYKKEGDQEATA